MEYTPGMVVKSLAGHDAGSFYVVDAAQDGFCYIADGRLRSLASPKKKNPRHLQATGSWIDLSQVDTDRKLKEALRPLNSKTEKGGN